MIREFALKKPVFRIVANTQTSMGATGYTTGLAPSMSLGCGAYAGNITSDNITPLHLINIKRLAWATSVGAPRPAHRRPLGPAALVLPPHGDAGPRLRLRGRRAAGAPGGADPRASSAGRIVTPAARDLAAGRTC